MNSNPQSLAVSEIFPDSRTLFEGIIDGLIVIDAETMQVILVNETAARLFGFDNCDDAAGLNPLDFIHPDDREEVAHAIAVDMFEKELHYISEYRATTHNGREIWIETTGTKIEYHGRYAGLVSLRDITNRKQMEKELKENEQKFHLMFELSPESIVLLDGEGTILDSNQRVFDWLGYLREEFVGKNILEIPVLTESSKVIAIESLARRLAGEEIAPYELTFIDRDGEYRIGLTMANRIQIEGDPNWYDMVMISDVTERKLIEEEQAILIAAHEEQSQIVSESNFELEDILTKTKEEEEALRQFNEELERRVSDRTIELQASNQELESFIYSLSHDLRTPLRGIEGFSQVLLEDCAANLDAEGLNYLNRIKAGTQRMSSLIDDILKLSVLSHKEICIETVDMSSMAQEFGRRVQSSQPERMVELVVEENVSATGDKDMLRTVVVNLLDNSWKYTRPHSNARIEFGTIQEKDETIYFVRDDGVGFDMKFVGKIFEPFQLLHSAHEFKGSGIGLAMVKRIISRHGGRVWAESEVEKGSTFYFTLQGSPD